MEKRRLGQSNLEVSALGYGCMGLNFAYGPGVEKQTAISTVRTAFEDGVTFFDTAEAYGPFTNEELVGEAVAPFRDQIVLRRDEVLGFTGRRFGQAGMMDSLARARSGLSMLDAALEAAEDGSAHRSLLPATASTRTCRSARGGWNRSSDLDPGDGKVKHFGLSEAGADTIRRAHAVQPVTAVQSEYSLWWRQPEEQILPALEELGIGFVAFSPLGRGFLTGSIDAQTSFAKEDFRNSLPRFSLEARQANQALVDEIRSIAETKRATPAQIALAWLLLLQRGSWIVPIPGTTKVNRLKENIGAATVALTPDDLRRMGEALAKIKVQGDRYPAHLAASVGR